MDVLGWMKHKLESRLPGEISITSNMQTHRPDGRKWTETKESPAGGERRKWKSWLKTQCSKNEDHGIRSHHFMANRWGNNVNSDRLYFLGSKITADGDCSHEIKRRLLLERKAMTNLDSIWKSKDITLLTKVHIIKAMMLKLKLQHFGHLIEELTHLKRPWCWERLRAGGEGDDKDEMVGWHHQLNGHEFGWTPGVGGGQGGLACCSLRGHKESDTTEQLNWTELNWWFFW